MAGAVELSKYLMEVFALKLDDVGVSKLINGLTLRLDSKIGSPELAEILDDSIRKGGLGLNRVTVDKIVREVEIIMLLKYSET